MSAKAFQPKPNRMYVFVCGCTLAGTEHVMLVIHICTLLLPKVSKDPAATKQLCNFLFYHVLPA